MTRRPSRGLAGAVAVTACVLLAACGSSGVESAAPSSSSPIPSGPASVSVPPGVPKDSVLDLNSTKDMTGVVTTVSFADSPYAAHLPDLCEKVTPAIMRELSVASKKKGFTGSELVAQTCALSGTTPGFDIPPFTTGTVIVINNIQEVLAKPGNEIIRSRVQLGQGVAGTVFKQTAVDLPTPGNPIQSCRIAWGTFFGAASVIFTINDVNYAADPCERAVAAAKILLGAFPKSPSEMRATP